MQGMCAHCAKEIDASYLSLYTSRFRSFYACKECIAWFKTMDDTYDLDWKKIEKTT
jgi:hypothetical protein